MFDLKVTLAEGIISYIVSITSTKLEKMSIILWYALRLAQLAWNPKTIRQIKFQS